MTITHTEVARFIELYESGLSLRQVAAETGRSNATIRKHMIAAGYDLRPRRQVLVGAVADECAAKYADGWSLNQLRGFYGVEVSSIREMLLKRDVKMRKRGNTRKVVDDATADRVVELYASGLSQEGVAAAIGDVIGQVQVSRILRSRGVVPRSGRGSPGGASHHAWRGGRVKAPGGYVGVLVAPDDPFAVMRNRMGYALEHRLVMARSLGRPLDPSESVHHINGIRDDNRVGNLQLRQGKHGKGAAFACGDCGSRNIVPAKIEGAPMYHCAACGLPAEVRDDVLTRACDCDAPVIAEARVELHGAGGVR